MLKTRKVKKETEKVTIRLQDAILKKFTKKKSVEIDDGEEWNKYYKNF